MAVDWANVARIRDSIRVPADWEPPKVLPALWEIEQVGADGAVYRSHAQSLCVILTCAVEQDRHAWLHLSLSHAARIPSWRELREAKEIFLGDREAYQILPPKERYVNIHPHVLHLFARLVHDPVLPDFTHGSGSL